MKQRYYTIDRIKKTDAQYCIILGERSNGKSYSVKHECVCSSIKDSERKKFVYLRRRDIDVRGSRADNYFNDVNTRAITNEEYQGILSRGDRIYLTTKDEKTGRMKYTHPIGYKHSLNQDEHYKSGVFTDCSNIAFEEFVTTNGYLSNEPNRLQHYVSTVFRRNKGRVWLIGNTISRISPYFQQWKLHRIPRQQPGTIDIYEHETDQLNEDGTPVVIKIAVEFSEGGGTNSKMFFGSVARGITNSVWQSGEHPRLYRRYETFNQIYVMVVEQMGFMFLCQFLADIDNKAYFWYVTPKTTPVQKGTRLITDRIIVNNHTTKGLYPLSDNEKKMFDFLIRGVIFYSDDLTGTDFSSCMQNLLRISTNFR